MFFPGTKLKILYSSTNTKASPRKNSIGYLSNSTNINIFECACISGIVAKCSIYFSKFGNESNTRCEKKDVILLIPKSLYRYNIELLLRKNEAKIRNNLALTFGCKISCPILIPTISMEIDTITVAYLNSIMKSDKINMFIQKAELSNSTYGMKNFANWPAVSKTIMNCYNGAEDLNKILDLTSDKNYETISFLEDVNKLSNLYRMYTNRSEMDFLLKLNLQEGVRAINVIAGLITKNLLNVKVAKAVDSQLLYISKNSSIGRSKVTATLSAINFLFNTLELSHPVFDKYI